MKTPSYVKSLLQHSNGKKGPSRKVWSIDLESTWVPFFTATNVMEETAVPSEDLGAPLRLVKAKDGSVKFTQSGRPSMRIAPVLNGHIRMVRENFAAGLQSYTGNVQKDRPDDYKAEVEKAQKAAAPIYEAQEKAIQEAITQAIAATPQNVVEEAEAIAEGQQSEAVTA